MAVSKTVTLDVRDDLRAGADPFEKIAGTVDTLSPGDRLEIINIFEPVPLYAYMQSLGYAHRTERTPEGDWKVTFFRNVQ